MNSFPSLFSDLRLCLHAPDLFCDVTFPLIFPFPPGHPRIIQDSYVNFTFDFSFPTPFYLFADFNLLPDETSFVFDFSDSYVLTPSFTQDTLFVTAAILQIQMYNSNVTIAYNSHSNRHTAQSRRPFRRLRDQFTDEDPFRLSHRRLIKQRRPTRARRQHERLPRLFFDTIGEAQSL